MKAGVTENLYKRVGNIFSVSNLFFMKRIKLFLIGVAFLAAGSAFTTVPKQYDPLYVKDAGNWVLKSTVDQNTGECVMTPEDIHCSFTLSTGATQPYQDSDFIPADNNSVWQRY